MEAQRFFHLSVMLSWISVYFFHSVFSETELPRINLENRVFVSLTGKDLIIKYDLFIPSNQSEDALVCLDPLQTPIYELFFLETNDPLQYNDQTLELKNLKRSGEYSCHYKTAEVFWFVCLRDEGYKDPRSNTYLIVATVFTCILLAFSVIGTVLVFRGFGRECITKCGDTIRKKKQNREERNQSSIEEDSVVVMTATSSSLYASLEPRAGSVYDVLDRSLANADQSKAKPKKKEPKYKIETTQPKEEAIFDTVYENF